MTVPQALQIDLPSSSIPVSVCPHSGLGHSRVRGLLDRGAGRGCGFLILSNLATGRWGRFGPVLSDCSADIVMMQLCCGLHPGYSESRYRYS